MAAREIGAASRPTMLNAPENDCWFRDEVQVHEGTLRTWLRGRYPALIDVDNIVHEAMLRVWHTRGSVAVGSPRALLFTAAQNLAIDQLRRQNIVPMESVAEMSALPVMEESPPPSEIAARNQELELLTKAIQSLPEKCRQVLTLRKIYGLSQKEIAARLGISEHTVEAQVGNGIRRCAAYLARLGLP